MRTKTRNGCTQSVFLLLNQLLTYLPYLTFIYQSSLPPFFSSRTALLCIYLTFTYPPYRTLSTLSFPAVPIISTRPTFPLPTFPFHPAYLSTYLFPIILCKYPSFPLFFLFASIPQIIPCLTLPSLLPFFLFYSPFLSPLSPSLSLSLLKVSAEKNSGLDFPPLFLFSLLRSGSRGPRFESKQDKSEKLKVSRFSPKVRSETKFK